MKRFNLYLVFLFKIIPVLSFAQVIDSTFGEPFSFSGLPNNPIYGVTACDFEGRDDRCYGMMFLNNGKIILAGHTSAEGGTDFAFTRLLPDGKFDQSAGPDGEVRLDLGHPNDSCLAAVRYDSDKMLMGGCVKLQGNAGYINLLVCTDFDGNLDSSFGDMGQVILDLPSQSEMITEILPQSDGKIIVGGNMFFGPSLDFPDSIAIFLARLFPDGQIDSTYGDNGFISQRFETCNATIIGDAEISTDGSVLATGGGFHPYPGDFDGDGIWCSHGIYLYRFLSDGQPDSDFGTNGMVVLPLTVGRGDELYLCEDGKILVGGITGDGLGLPSYTIVAKLLPNGTIDSTFGEGGYFREFIFGTFGDGATPIDIVSVNNEYLIAYDERTVGDNLTFGVFCLTESGMLNQEFGEEGVFKYINALPSTGYKMKEVILSDDLQSIYLAGTYQQPLHRNMMVSKLNIFGKNPTGATEQESVRKVVIFPNPVHAEMNVFLTGDYLPTEGIFTLFDTTGKAQMIEPIRSGRNSIHLSGLSTGIYFYEVKDGEKKIGGGKLIKQ